MRGEDRLGRLSRREDWLRGSEHVRGGLGEHGLGLLVHVVDLPLLGGGQDHAGLHGGVHEAGVLEVDQTSVDHVGIRCVHGRCSRHLEQGGGEILKYKLPFAFFGLGNSFLRFFKFEKACKF